MITVIVPVYKVEKYLRRCVASIVNQTYRDLQIILVDDGSPDDCGRICDELASEDERIYVLHQSNSGQAAARNNALSWAIDRGFATRDNYFTFVDSDDTIEPTMYQTMLDIMTEDLDLIICGHRIVQEGCAVQCSEAVDSAVTSLDVDGLWDEVFGQLNNAVWNKLYRAELARDVRFPTELRHGEDLIFNLAYLTKCQSGKKISTKFYNYLKRKDSVTTSKFSKTKLMEIASKDMARKFVAKYHPALEIVAQKYCFRARMNVLRGIYRANAENTYVDTINMCVQYVYKNYPVISNSLRLKERIEFLFLRFARPIYVFFSKCSK